MGTCPLTIAKFRGSCDSVVHLVTRFLRSGQETLRLIRHTGKLGTEGVSFYSPLRSLKVKEFFIHELRTTHGSI